MVNMRNQDRQQQLTSEPKISGQPIKNIGTQFNQEPNHRAMVGGLYAARDTGRCNSSNFYEKKEII